MFYTCKIVKSFKLYFDETSFTMPSFLVHPAEYYTILKSQVTRTFLFKHKVFATGLTFDKLVFNPRSSSTQSKSLKDTNSK